MPDYKLYFDTSSYHLFFTSNDPFTGAFHSYQTTPHRAYWSDWEKLINGAPCQFIADTSRDGSPVLRITVSDPSILKIEVLVDGIAATHFTVPWNNYEEALEKLSATIKKYAKSSFTLI